MNRRWRPAGAAAEPNRLSPQSPFADRITRPGRATRPADSAFSFAAPRTPRASRLAPNRFFRHCRDGRTGAKHRDRRARLNAGELGPVIPGGEHVGEEQEVVLELVTGLARQLEAVHI